MKNSELDQVLRTARVPEPGKGFWDTFPGRVVTEIRQRERQSGKRAEVTSFSTSPEHGLRLWLSGLRCKPIMLIGCAAACIVLAFVFGVWQGRHSAANNSELAAAQKYFREIEGLFPNQVQAIVLDQAGAHLVLADRPDVPASAPLYLKICDAAACRRFVTFSGQKIRVNGDVLDVLVDRQGAVLVVGEQSVWSSSQPSAKAGRYRIEARPLPAAS